jgi:hypothetical protein
MDSGGVKNMGLVLRQGKLSHNDRSIMNASNPSVNEN